MQRLKLALDRDGFGAGERVVTDKSLKKISFILENRTGDEHTTELSLAVPAGSSCKVILDGKPVPWVRTGIWDYPLRAELRVAARQSRVEIVRTDR